MQTATSNQELGSPELRQSAGPARSSTSSVRASADQSPSVQPILLTDAQAAQALGVGVSTFHTLRHAEWMPRPIVLTPRIVRWARAELERAMERMPRQERAGEPAQLRRGRIEAMKRSGQ